MTVQININPETGLTYCGNSNAKEDTCQLLFSTVLANGPMHFGLGTPNVLYNAEQLIRHSMTKKDVGLKDVCLDPYTYWAVDNRPVGTKQIIDSGLFTYLYGGKKNAPLKEVERFSEYYIELVNNHFKEHCFTNNMPWFVELDLHGRFPLEDYHRIQKKLLDSCPNRDFIGVWHDEWGLKQLDEVCERFDYVGLSLAGGWNWDIVFGVASYINKKYPGRCIHLLGTSAVNGLSWGGLMKHCDTMDCTGWSRDARYGLASNTNREPQRGKWVKPGEDFINQHLLRLFPGKPGEGKDPISGWTYTNREAALWVICRAYGELTRACLYGHQKQWENGSFRGVIQKILQGKGAELQESDITAPIYDMEFFHHDKTGFDFWAPVDHEKGWHYKDKFKNTVNFIKPM